LLEFFLNFEIKLNFSGLL